MNGIWKRMAAYEPVGQAQFSPKLADLVFEELAQGFHQSHVHALW